MGSLNTEPTQELGAGRKGLQRDGQQIPREKSNYKCPCDQLTNGILNLVKLRPLWCYTLYQSMKNSTRDTIWHFSERAQRVKVTLRPQQAFRLERAPDKVCSVSTSLAPVSKCICTRCNLGNSPVISIPVVRFAAKYTGSLEPWRPQHWEAQDNTTNGGVNSIGKDPLTNLLGDSSSKYICIYIFI